MPGGRTQDGHPPSSTPAQRRGCRGGESCAPLSGLQGYSRHTLPLSYHEAPRRSVTLSSVALHRCDTPFPSTWPLWAPPSHPQPGVPEAMLYPSCLGTGSTVETPWGQCPRGPPPGSSECGAHQSPLLCVPACLSPATSRALSQPHTQQVLSKGLPGWVETLNTTSLKCTEQNRNLTKILVPILHPCQLPDLKRAGQGVLFPGDSWQAEPERGRKGAQASVDRVSPQPPTSSQTENLIQQLFFLEREK